VQDNKVNVIEKYSITKKYILAFGSTEPRKNNLRLIKAFNAIKKSITDISLVIVGKEWRDRKFDSVLLHDKIILTGYVPDEDIPYLYKNAEIVVFPSLYEGFGLPVLEAMTYGIPVVASNTSSLPEVGGDAVEYADPNDVSDIARAIKDLLDSEEKRKYNKEKGMLRAKQFNWRSMCKQILSVCKEATQ
jgi:glycosyltransferase involved in cell wall biosynthesis